jgi:hypothetical protein
MVNRASADTRYHSSDLIQKNDQHTLSWQQHHPTCVTEIVSEMEVAQSMVLLCFSDSISRHDDLLRDGTLFHFTTYMRIGRRWLVQFSLYLHDLFQRETCLMRFKQQSWC